MMSLALAIALLGLVFLLVAAETNHDDYDENHDQNHDDRNGGVPPSLLVIVVLCDYRGSGGFSEDEGGGDCVESVAVGLDIAVGADLSIASAHETESILLGGGDDLDFLGNEPLHFLVTAGSGETAVVIVHALR